MSSRYKYYNPLHPATASLPPTTTNKSSSTRSREFRLFFRNSVAEKKNKYNISLESRHKTTAVVAAVEVFSLVIICTFCGVHHVSYTIIIIIIVSSLSVSYNIITHARTPVHYNAKCFSKKGPLSLSVCISTRHTLYYILGDTRTLNM